MRSAINLSSISTRKLRAELKRREEVKQFKSLPITERPEPKIQIYIAGEDLTEGILVVVDETTRECFEHPRTEIIPGQRRIHGYVVLDTKKGKRLQLRHWFTEKIEGEL